MCIRDRYSTKAYFTWEHFKFAIKHYNRFFDVDAGTSDTDFRKQILDDMRPILMEYENLIPVGSVFYRARKNDPSLNFESLIINKELSPAPPKHAQTNRMSPAGISYLYVSSEKETACAECRYTNADVIIAQYIAKQELQIIDFSEDVYITNQSIFSEKYDHDLYWLNHFLKLFAAEISKPVNCEKSDHSYEYAATQVIAEYIRSLGYDGICYKSSVSKGKSYCFFCGPDFEFCKNDYGIILNDSEYYQIPQSFLDLFSIDSISLLQVSESGNLHDPIKIRNQ